MLVHVESMELNVFRQIFFSKVKRLPREKPAIIITILTMATGMQPDIVYSGNCSQRIQVGHERPYFTTATGTLSRSGK